MKALFDLLAWSVEGVSFLIVILVLFRFHILKGFLKFYGLWTIGVSIIEIASARLPKLGIQNIFLFHINAIIEFVLLTLLFDVLLTETGTKSIKKIIIPGTVALLLNSLLLEKVETINAYALTIISLGVVLGCIYYYFRLTDLKLDSNTKILRMITVGSIFVLHNSNLIPLLFGNYLMASDPKAQLIIWVVRACVILIVKIMIFFILLTQLFYDE